MPTRSSSPGRVRLAFWIALVVSWLVQLPLLWAAFTTVPSAERLSRSHMIEIPTFGTVASTVAQSAVELAVVLALLFPWRPRGYLARLWLAAVGVWVWFIATTPLSLTRVAWVHRRWLAAVGAVLLLAAALATVAGLYRRHRGRRARPH